MVGFRTGGRSVRSRKLIPPKSGGNHDDPNFRFWSDDIVVPAHTGLHRRSPRTTNRRAEDAIKSSCRSDYMSNCMSVKPGGPEALMCLKSHMATLSPACQAAVNSALPPPPAKAAPPPAVPPAPKAVAAPPPPPPPPATASPASPKPKAKAVAPKPAPPPQRQAVAPPPVEAAPAPTPQ